MNAEPAALEFFSSLYLRVNSLPTAERVWERLLTDMDRLALGGSLPAAWNTHRGTVGFWAKLRSVSTELAVVDLGVRLGFLDLSTHDWLLRELGLAPVPANETSGVRKILPHWNPDRRELRFDDVVIRRIRNPMKATNVLRVLTEFQELGWPERLEDPLPGRADSLRLHATIRSLNTGLKLIRFTSDGSGHGYVWHRL